MTHSAHHGLDRRGLLVGGVTIFGGMWLLGRGALAREAALAREQAQDAPPRALLLLPPMTRAPARRRGTRRLQARFRAPPPPSFLGLRSCARAPRTCVM